MARPLWSGSISFGLVNVPVRLYSAVREHKLHFHYVHEPDSSPIGYQKVCKAEEKPVPDNEIVKAFEIAKGEYVHLSDEDFEQARGELHRTIDIQDFVPVDEIDPIYFAKTYYLGPVEGAEAVFSLFLRALEESSLVAVSTFALRDRGHLGALRARKRGLVLEQLYWADEVLPSTQIEPARKRVGKDELAMALRLIESASSSWKPERYEDTYEVELRKAIDARRTGEGVHEAPDTGDGGEAVDLMEALRASVEQRSKQGGRRKKRRAAA